MLCDKGYSVWLLNNRGNRYSSQHAFFTNIPNNPLYWDYCFDDLVFSDLPAIVEFIKETTHFEKLIYIGHSQGASQILCLLSEKPDF